MLQPTQGNDPAPPHANRFQIPAIQRQDHALDVARRGLGDRFGSTVESIDILRVHQRVYSRVLDCTTRHTDGQRHRVMVKIYEPIGAATEASLGKLISDDFEITAHLHRHFISSPRFQVPTPLFHSPGDMLLVTEHMPGMQLQEKLIAKAGWYPSQATLRDLELNCRSCGEWLRAFQGATLGSVCGGLDLDRMRNMIATRLEWLVDDTHLPVDRKKGDLILAHFDREVGALKPADLTVASVHGDFFPGNVLVEEDRVVGLDFAMCRIGSIAADPSYFMFQLETLTYKPKFRRRMIRKLQHAFLQGYNPAIAAENYFTSSPVVRIHFILHNVMRLAGMTAPKANMSWKRKLHNWGVAIAVTRRLTGIALNH
jgi:hypothetical protein